MNMSTAQRVPTDLETDRSIRRREGRFTVSSANLLARVTGVLFVIATAAALAAAALLPDVTGTDSLTHVSDNPNRMAGAALFYLVAAFTSAGIAISLYPLLKQWNEGLALGSVVFRALEAAMYIVAVVSLLSLLALSRKFADAGTADQASLRALGDSLQSGRDVATLAGVIAFSIGAFMYYVVFFQSRLVPRWLSGWGIVGVALMMTACILALFSGDPVTGYTLLIVPIFLQELTLAVWLIAKGFDSAVVPWSVGFGSDVPADTGEAVVSPTFR